MKYTQKKGNVHGQRKKLASPNAKDNNMLVFLASANAKLLLFALPDAKVPDARYFAFWWNIGLRVAHTHLIHQLKALISFSIWLHNIVIHATSIKGNVNLKPTFSLLFFDPRYLVYYGEYIFVILRTSSERWSEGNHVSEFDLGPGFNLMSRNAKICLFL